jgi:hypothetical protein
MLSLLFSDSVEGIHAMYTPVYPKMVAAATFLDNLDGFVANNLYSRVGGHNTYVTQVGSLHLSAALTHVRNTGYVASHYESLEMENKDVSALGGTAAAVLSYPTVQFQGKLIPEGFQICATARNMLSKMQTIITDGVPFACTVRGKMILRSMSRILTFRDAVTKANSTARVQMCADKLTLQDTGPQGGSWGTNFNVSKFTIDTVEAYYTIRDSANLPNGFGDVTNTGVNTAAVLSEAQHNMLVEDLARTLCAHMPRIDSACDATFLAHFDTTMFHKGVAYTLIESSTRSHSADDMCKIADSLYEMNMM